MKKPYGWNRLVTESFKLTERAFAIQKGKMYVSQQDFPDSPEWQPRYRGKSLLTFAGADHLELDVADARALRDWLTTVLPDQEHDKNTDTGDNKLNGLIEAVTAAVFACGECDGDDEGRYDELVEKASKARQELSSYLRERLPQRTGDEHG